MPTDICICVCTCMKLNFFAQTICTSIQFSLYQLCVYECVRVWFFCFVYTLQLHNGVATKFACCCHIHTPIQSHVSLYLRPDVAVELHSRNCGGTHTRTHKQRDSQRHIQLCCCCFQINYFLLLALQLQCSKRTSSLQIHFTHKHTYCILFPFFHYKIIVFVADLNIFFCGSSPFSH